MLVIYRAQREMGGAALRARTCSNEKLFVLCGGDGGVGVGGGDMRRWPVQIIRTCARLANDDENLTFSTACGTVVSELRNAESDE